MDSKTIHHVCIQTDCYKESLYFYTEILGFRIIKETANFHGRDYNTWLELNHFMIELQTPKTQETFEPYSKTANGIVHLCFRVDNIHKELQAILDKGYKSFKTKNNHRLYQVEDGYLFKVKAPEGTEIEFRDSEI